MASAAPAWLGARFGGLATGGAGCDSVLAVGSGDGCGVGPEGAGVACGSGTGVRGGLGTTGSGEGGVGGTVACSVIGGVEASGLGVSDEGVCSRAD